MPGKANYLERPTKGSSSLWAMPLGVMLTGLRSDTDFKMTEEGPRDLGCLNSEESCFLVVA